MGKRTAGHGNPLMATARQNAIAEKRRRGIRPYCRKRMLTPRAIHKAQQTLGAGPAELNPDFSTTLPAPIQKPKRGAPQGNTNRLIHGKYARHVLAFRARMRAHIREARTLIAATRKMLRGDPDGIAWFGDIREVPATPSDPRFSRTYNPEMTQVDETLFGGAADWP